MILRYQEQKIARKRAVFVPKDAAHLKQHRFAVAGAEPLGKKNPICAHLHESDDAVVRAMDDRRAYIRELIRKDLRG